MSEQASWSSLGRIQPFLRLSEVAFVFVLCNLLVFSPVVVDADGTRTVTITETLHVDSTVTNHRNNSISTSLSETRTPQTPSYTVTQSMSLDLPIHKAEVFRTTKASIPSHCISGDFDTAENRICRSLVFRMINDGFPTTSQALTFEAQYQWMRYVGGGEINPFGLAAQWDYFRSTAKITSNISHLTIQPIRNPGLVIVTNERFSINFSFPDATLRRELPLPNMSYFEFEVYPSDQRKPQPFMETTLVASAMISVVAAFLPMNPVVSDVQVTIMSGLSFCMQPTIYQISISGQRALYPAAEVDESLFTKMISNVILLCGFVAFHLVSVMAVMLRTGDPFPEAAGKALFPSMSFSMATFLQAGNIIGGVKLMSSITSPREDRGLGLIGILIGILVLLTPILAVKLFRASNRKHDNTLWGFPYLVRLFMPESSWGPNSETHMWLVPLGALAPHKLKYANLNLAYITLFAFVCAFEPETPYGCVGFFSVLIVLSIAHAVIILALQPYRSRSLNWASAVSNMIYVTPMVASMARSFDLTGSVSVSETAVASLMGLCYVTAFVRAAGSIAATILEQKVIRHRVWPDRKEKLPDRAEEEKTREENLERRNEPMEPEVLDEVMQYRPPVDEEMLADPDVDPDDQMMQTFGAPAPIVLKRPLPKPSRKALKNNARLRDPMVNLVRDGGLLPPAVKAQREEEYLLI